MASKVQAIVDPLRWRSHMLMTRQILDVILLTPYVFLPAARRLRLRQEPCLGGVIVVTAMQIAGIRARTAGPGPTNRGGSSE